MKTPAVPYFSIFNKKNLKQYLISASSKKENPSRTLFLLFEEYNTQPHLSRTLF